MASKKHLLDILPTSPPYNRMTESSIIQRTPIETLSLTSSDGRQILVTTKEAKEEIKDYIHKELNSFTTEVIFNKEQELKQELETRFNKMERLLLALLDHKWDQLAEKIVDKLITRKFNEEVERRVTEKLNNKGNKF